MNLSSFKVWDRKQHMTSATLLHKTSPSRCINTSTSTNTSTDINMASADLQASSQDTVMQDSVAQDEAWKVFKHSVPFLAIPPEIHLKIFSLLNPIDAVCLSLVNKSIYTIAPRISRRTHPMQIGAPFSSYPVIEKEGCRHCVPVLYYPAHCELHYHLRSFMPKHLNFCGALCEKYTRCEDKGYSDSEEYCGVCGTEYWRRYERGRRILDLRRPGEKQERLCKWYNDPRQ